MNSTLAKVLAVGMFLSVSILSIFSQSFVNLNFESAQIIPIAGSPIYPYAIEVTNALPGWTVFYGGSDGSQSQASQINYNAPATGSTFVNLWATNGQQISGNYSVLLQGGVTAPSASIAQTGLVPIGSESIFFEAQAGPITDADSLLVSLGGENLSFYALATGSNYTLYGAAIPTEFDGQLEQLEFSALGLGSGGNNWNLDNIQFSTSPVPEPSTMGLIGLGGLFFGWRWWKHYSV